MSKFTAIDLSKIPAPEVVEELSFESLLQAMKDDLQQRDSSLTAISLESEPVVKLLEVCAYRELLLRQRINDASRSVMLAHAMGSDLDNLAALFSVERLLVMPGNPDVVPPIPPEYESDARLRARVQLSLEGLSTAGPVGAYVFHAFSASSNVKDVDVTSPSPGEVQVTVLSTTGNGTPDVSLLDKVNGRLNDEHVRPLTDYVRVQAAEIKSYQVKAELSFYAGPDKEVVRLAAEHALRQYVDDRHRLGHDVTLSGLYAALHQPGVQKVNLQEPTSELVVASNQAAWCHTISVTAGGIDE